MKTQPCQKPVKLQHAFLLHLVILEPKMGRTFFEALPGVFETNVAILVWFENAAFHLQRHSKSTLGAISRAPEKRPDH